MGELANGLADMSIDVGRRKVCGDPAKPNRSTCIRRAPEPSRFKYDRIHSNKMLKFIQKGRLFSFRAGA